MLECMRVIPATHMHMETMYLQLCNTHDEPNQWLPWDGISLDTESHNIFDELYEWGKNLKAWVGKPLGLITPHVKEKIKSRREIQ